MRWIRSACVIALIVATFAVKSSASAETPDVSKSSQLMLVLTDTWDAAQAVMLLFTRDGKGWHKDAEFPAVVGSKGLAWAYDQLPDSDGARTKKEGDRKGPAGILRLRKAMGYEAVPPSGTIFPYEQIQEGMHCVDDQTSTYYNRIVSEMELPGPPKELWKSSEIMKRNDILYKWLMVVDYNVQTPKPGAGSCIFIHVWRTPEKGTAGCTAMEETNVTRLMAWLKSDRNPILVQLPKQEYQKLWKDWGLPSPELLIAH